MIINRAYKYELDLNNAQRTACLKHAGAARWAFNFGLQRKKEAYASGEKTPTAIDLHRELVLLKKKEIPWMYDVSKCAPQEALRNLDRAFTNFFARRCRFPKFKSRKKSVGSFRLTGCIYISGNMIQLPRLGKLRLKEESKAAGRILSATVRQVANRWFVSLQVETSITVPDNQGPAVGVDLGVANLATLSNGQVFENPKAYRRKLKVLKRAQRNLSRRRAGSKRYDKARRRVARLYYITSCIRSDAIHKMTTLITKTHSAVGIEDLKVSNMLKNHYLASAISDASFGEIRRQLEYKCKWYGSELIVHNQFVPSSKKCSKCGVVKAELSLSERVFRCICGYKADRDLNAAINLQPGVPRLLDVDGKALAVGKPTTKPTRKKRQPNIT